MYLERRKGRAGKDMRSARRVHSGRWLLYVMYVTDCFRANVACIALMSCLLVSVKHPGVRWLLPRNTVALTRVNVHAPAVATVRLTGRQR